MTKQFSRGEKLKLSDLGISSKFEVSITVSGKPGQTFDVCCFGLDNQAKLSDDRYMIFYNQTRSPCNGLSIVAPAPGETQRFAVDLSKLPPGIKQLVFTITIDDAGDGNMSSANGQLRLLSGSETKGILPIQGKDFSTEKAIMVSEIYSKDIWRFSAVGQGFAGGLSALLRHFGGEEAGTTAPQATPAPAAPSPVRPQVSYNPPPQPQPSAPPVGDTNRFNKDPQPVVSNTSSSNSGFDQRRNTMGTNAHEIDYFILGDDIQTVEVELDPGETVIAEAGAMNYMEEGIEFECKMGDGTEAKQGMLNQLFGAGKRMMMGESIMITHFTNRGRGKQRVAFAAPYPGKIIPLNLGELGGQVLVQRDGFLCAAFGTKLEMAFTQRLGAGFFGGEGFILQRLSGNGLAFVHACGTIIKKELRGQKLRVDTGCLVAFTPGIDYNIQRAGNIKSMIFGGEGLFLATLSGHGTVWLQSLPFARMAQRIVGATGSAGGPEQTSGLMGSITNLFEQ